MVHKILTLLLLCCTNIFAQNVQNVVLRPGVPYGDIKNPNHPRAPLQPDTTLEWNLSVDDGGTIKVVCDDARMAQAEPWTPECKYIYIGFDEGQGETKVCGSNKIGYQYKSKGPKLTVRMVSKGAGGFIHCTAYNNREAAATAMELKPDGRVMVIGSPKQPVPNFDQVWTFNSPRGTKISLQCNYRLGASSKCYKDILTIDDGNGNREYCGESGMTIFTKENYAKVRLQLNEIGDLTAKCLVQAVTGPNANQYLNIRPVEEDSSEHGVTPGRRQTTCKCGWANKRHSRIMFGEQASENEFPWMVHLSMYKGGYKYGCGGSIITKRHVLTAAHCLFEKDSGTISEAQNVFATFAEHHRKKSSGKEVTIRAERVFVHDKYVEESSHDIGLIYLQETIPFSDIIGPVCLLPDVLPVLGKPIKIMGWGRTEKSDGSDILLKSKSPVIDRIFCNANEYEICVASDSSGTCSGDSGGPLVWRDPETNRYVQVSLVSRGHADCKSEPSVASLVSAFYDWIHERIRMTDPSAVTCHK